MPTLCIVLANCLSNTHRSGIDVVPSRRECIHVTKTKSVDMAPGAQLSSAMSIDMAPGRSRVFAAKNRCLLCSGGMSIDVPLAAQPRFFSAKNRCRGRRRDAC